MIASHTQVAFLGGLLQGVGIGPPLAATGNALYTLLGAGIAATAGLASVALKYRFDSKAETTRHSHELEKLKIELDARRADVDEDRRNRCLASVLAATSSLYEQVRTARRLRREGLIDDADYVARLRSASVEGGQTAVEELRLSCSPVTAAAADALWAHLRGSAVSRGATLVSPDWAAWKEEYWRLRQELITSSRPSENDGDPDQRSQDRDGSRGEPRSAS